MKYVQLHDHSDDGTIWLIWARGHVSAFDKARKIGVPKSFSMAMDFDPGRGPLFR